MSSERKGGTGKKSAVARPAQKSGKKAAEQRPTLKKSAVRTAPKASQRAATARKVRSGIVFSYKEADDRNMLDIIELVRTGIAYSDFDKIVNDTPFTLAEWANYLQISERTIQRNEKEKKPFQPIQSERIVELSMLYQYGVEVFGDKDNFNVWLNSKSMALGGRTPKELLDTKFGIGMVKDELGRIEHGVLA